MRLEKLILSGWGPYASQEEVDFSAFGKEGIFLIGGATGGGKTTIFDGITYALYGETSTKAREKDFLRSDFARPETDTFVELAFSHKGKKCRVWRSPKYSRPKKRGKGETTSNESAALYVEEEAPVTALREVNQRLVEIVGISYRQFKQTAMIAQGEFLELLLAKSKDRSEIFRDLFGTGEQERFQKKLGEKAREAYGRLLENRHKMEEALSQIRTEREEAKEELSSEYPNYGRLLELVQEEAREDREEIAALLKKAEGIEGKKRKLEEKNQEWLSLKTRLGQQRERAAACEKEQAEAKERQERAMDKALKEQAAFDRRRQQLEQEQAEKKRQAAELGRKIEELGRLEEELSQSKLSLSKLEHELSRHREWSEKRAQVERQQEQLRMAQQKYRKAESYCRGIRQAYEEKDSLYRAAAIGFAAKYLEPGRPCPVCGSLDHPNPAPLSEGAPDEKEVERWKEKWQEAEGQKNQAFHQASQAKGSLEAMAEELEAALERAAIEGDKLDGAIQALERQGKEEQKRMAVLESQLEEKKRLQRQREEMEQEQALFMEQKERQEKQREARMGELKREEEEQKLLAESRRILLEELRKEEADLEKALSSCLEKLFGREDGLGAEKLQQELDSLEQERKELLAKKESKLVKAAVNERAISRIGESQRERERLQEKYSVAKGLEQAASGKNKERLAFEQYVLSAYFEEVVAAANLRLERMSGGRYQLCRGERPLDGRAVDGLSLEVLDHFTGKKRPVKTLSGGESFKAALSLALGLSDMAQNYAGGIQIETLFIDEGFGALDEESLDQAMEALEMLTEQGRLIGIISHVPGLKERIEKQVTVEKGRDGSHIRG